MRIRWRDFEIPNAVVRDEASTGDYGKFLVEPFERGFGVTVGNSLRRILLSSLEGSAVVSAKIEGVQHEFSSMTGVYEDVTDIILNLKNVILAIHGSADSASMRIRRDRKGDVTAADIEHGPEVSIINKDLHIATLTQDIPFHVDLQARKGRGYATAEENSRGDNEIGIIWLDASFSPVLRVRYKTENTRVGQRTNYDRLILEVWTNGSVAPDLALVEASKILRRHLNPFIQYAEIGYSLQPGETLNIDEPTIPEDIEDLRRKLDLPVSALELSVRAYNCLDAEGIKSLRDLVVRDEADLLKVRNFGRTTLDEIEQRLETLGLTLGMDLPAEATS